MINLPVSEKEFADIVLNSFSISEVCRKLHFQRGRFKVIKKLIKKLKLSTSHFTGQLWSKNKKLGPKVDIQDYLSNSKRISSNQLKQKLFDNCLKERKCEKCNLETWMGQPIPLDLHHKDCDHFNNNLENLIILCANCHAQCHATKKNIKQPIRLPDESFIQVIPQCKNIREVLIRLNLGAAGQNYTRVKLLIVKYNLRFKT